MSTRYDNLIEAFLVENDIVVNVGVFETEEDVIEHGYRIIDVGINGIGIGDNVSDEALQQRVATKDLPDDTIIESEQLWRIEDIRKERDARLAETDYWTLPDMPEMTAEQIAYRQALRDYPNQILAREPDEVSEGENGWCNISFPVKP